MANTNAPFGLSPAQRIDGAALSFQITTRLIAYNAAEQIGKGDLVTSEIDGTITRFTTGDTNSAGVFWGCEYLDPGLGYITWRNAWTAPTLPSTTIVTAYVIMDPMIAFEVQTNGGSGGATPVTSADIGANADVVNGTPAVTGFSTEALSVATIDNTATLPLRIWGLGRGIGNGYDAASAYNRVLVTLNTLQWTNRTGIHN